MARLPDASSLGGMPGATYSRPIVAADTSAIGAGVRQLGQGISDLGTGVAAYGRTQEREAAKNLQLNTARADAEFLTQEPELRKQFKDDDPDYEKWPAAYGEQAGALRKEIAERHIQDPRAREMWTLRKQDDIVRGTAHVAQRSKALNENYYLSTGVTNLENLQKTYLEAGDDEEMRVKVVDAGRGVIEDMRARGLVTEEKARTLSKVWVQSTGKMEVGALKTPLERAAALGGNQAALRLRESGNNPRAFNQFGYAGLEQFGAPRLQTIGLYTPGANEDMEGWSKSSRSAPGKWSGSLNIPGFPDVKTVQDFLGNEAAQNAVSAIDGKFKEKEIADNGLDKYVGKTVGGVTITVDGLKNMIHLGGVGGAKRALESDGANVARDANGTSVLDYARMGAGSGRATRLAEFIDPEERNKLLVTAQAEYQRDLRRDEVAKREESADIKALIPNDLASVERSGQGLSTETLSRERIAKALGEEAALEWEAERARAFKVHSALDGIEQLSEGEVERRLQAVEPVPGAADYVDQMKAYDRARDKSSKFLQARRADPALASETFQTVRAARQAAEYTEANGVRSITPESAQAIVGARLAAQGQLAIDEPMAVTKSEAAVLARQLRSIGDENPNQMRKFMESLHKTYGDFADEVLAATLQHQNVNRDLSVMASQVLGKIAQGLVPGSPEVRRIEDLISTQSLSKVMPAPPPLSRELQASRGVKLNARTVQNGREDEKPDPWEVTDPALANPEGVADIKRLIADPTLAVDFDMKYNGGGPGIAAKILKRYNAIKGPPNG